MENIIRILNVFYLASGLKINISKSNLNGVGVSSDEVDRMASGIGKFKNRLSGWKANLLSSGGRLTLIKSVLGSLGIYYLSIFKAPEAVLKVLESLRALFFWGATGDKRKLAWIKWSNILASLDKGGLDVLKSIHGEEVGIDLKGCQTNELWARIVGSIYHLHSSGYVPLNSIRFQVGDGSMNQNCLIKDRIVEGSWMWDWRRPVNGGRTQADLNNLLAEIGSLIIEVDRDSVVSSFSKDGSYSVSIVRKHIDSCMLPSSLPSTRWYKIIPRKVNIFMWCMFLDRLPHRLNLSSRGLDIDSIISCGDWDSWYSSWRASKDERD
ncbi:hypothetical protein Tco_1411430 [Tanacetum coccineum]